MYSYSELGVVIHARTDNLELRSLHNKIFLLGIRLILHRHMNMVREHHFQTLIYREIQKCHKSMNRQRGELRFNLCP